MTRIDLKTMCEEVLSGPLALAIGNFDGVHIGHRALLERVREAADALRGEIPHIRTGVWCFAQPPSAYLSDKPVRAGEFVCALACVFPNGEHEDFCVLGRARGEILKEYRGDKGFGYDPLFYFPPLDKTFAEMSAS